MLGHQQQAAAALTQAAVHAPLTVFENPVIEQALQQARGLRGGVAALDADQHHQAGTDFADAFTVDIHPGGGDTLQ